MKEKLLNNIGLKLVSLILAFIVWMAVVNISNPVITDTQTVTVEVRNPEVLTDANLTYEIDGRNTITVSYMVRTRDSSLIKQSDFKAYIDLQDYNVTGAVPVTVEISDEKKALLESRGEITVSPMVLHVVTEEMQNKTFELQTATVGETEEGFAPGVITLSPDVVTVRGPVSQIGQINHVGVEINLDGANEDFTYEATPKFYDANGNEFQTEDVTVEPGIVECQVSVLKSKELPLDFEVKGNVAEGYRFTGIDCDVKSVSVVGTKSVLASVSTLSVVDDKLNIEGATGDTTVELNLADYLPPSTSIVGRESYVVPVTLRVEPLASKEFTLSLDDVQITGMDSDYDYSFSEDDVTVTVIGLQEDLDTLEDTSLQPSMDVTDLDPGVYSAELTFQLDEGFDLEGYTEFQVTVSLKENGPDRATQSETNPSGTAEETEESE